MSTQGGQSLRVDRALMPAAATPQGKARTRSLADEWGAAVDLLFCCCVSACSSRFCFFWAMQIIFFFLLLTFFAPCGRLREAHLS